VVQNLTKEEGVAEYSKQEHDNEEDGSDEE
jgi:hypothetical protein